MSDNSTKYPPPKSGTEAGGTPRSAQADAPFAGAPTPPTDFASLSAPGPAPLPVHPEGRTDFTSLKAAQPTDFASLHSESRYTPKRRPQRTPVDLLLDALVPLMILVMVASLVYFLLDWRYIRSAYMHGNIKFAATMFIIGIVALNRVIARDGSEESLLYILALGVVVALYTFGLTALYPPEGRAGSLIPSLLDHQLWAAALNVTIVMVLWWVTNRLMHECCVDENLTSGDIGILTGTARRLRNALERKPDTKPGSADTIEAVDPTAWKPPEPKAPPKPLAPAERMSKRHPGISIFYFAAPAMAIFALGLRWTQHGGAIMVLTGHFYVGCFTTAALALLMLTSLAGLRNYFRSRRIEIPGGIGAFWVGLGSVFIVMVLVGAAALPLPGLPDIAYLAEHEIDPWVRGATFQAMPVAATPAKLLYESRLVERLGVGVLVCLGLFVAYGAVRAVGAFAFAIARRRHKYPQWVVRLFDLLERFLAKVTQMPHLPRFHPPQRVDPRTATSTKYGNPLSSSTSHGWTPVNHIEYAYDALCALALDLGVPRRPDQTPYEFIRSFPDRLKTLREEAQELTELLVMASYAGQKFDERIYDRLRKFWLSYDRLRALTVR